MSVLLHELAKAQAKDEPSHAGASLSPGNDLCPDKIAYLPLLYWLFDRNSEARIL